MNKLKPCKYRGQTNNPERFLCVSSKIRHSGTVHVSTCEICPFIKEKSSDFIEQTNDLFLVKNPSYRILQCCGGNKKIMSTSVVAPTIEKDKRIFDPVPKINITTDCKKHLTYHIYPTLKSNAWRWNLNILKRYWDIFNGKKIVAIVYDKFTEGPDTVKHFLLTNNFIFDTILVRRNNSNLREVITWLPMLKAIDITSMTDNDFIFSAHAKGVRHKLHNIHMKYWAYTMYHANLHNWSEIKEHLKTKLAVGIHRRFNSFSTPSNFCWHYSGSFFWWRPHDIVKRNNWKIVDQHFYGTESWLGHQMPPEYSECLFNDNSNDLYREAYWNEILINQWNTKYGKETLESIQ